MAYSMTAYGRATLSSETKDFLVEIKSVNNRFFDCTVKLPPEYGFLEEKVKAYIQSKGVIRGKINVFIPLRGSKGVKTFTTTFSSSFSRFILILFPKQLKNT